MYGEQEKKRIKVKKRKKRKQDHDCLWDQTPVSSLGTLAHQGLSLPLKDMNKHWHQHHFSQLRMTLSLNMPAQENPGPL